LEPRIKAPPLSPGEYGVLLCEADTGVVLLPDGGRRLGSIPYIAVLEKLHEAEDYARRRLAGEANMECSLVDSTGKHLMWIREP